MTAKRPEISVVIPSHNRREQLIASLRAFELQTIVPDRFEVIISLDAVTDGSAEAVGAIAWPFAVRLTIPESRGASAARNAGASLARAPRIVFLDDDIIVANGFLEAHLHSAMSFPGSVVLGESAPEIPEKDWFSGDLRQWWLDHYDELRLPGHRFGHLDVLSGNLSLDKALFERVGGFDLSLKIPREDYDLGYRLSLADTKFVFNPKAYGLHYDRSDLSRSFRRSSLEGTADVQIARKHPALFRTMRVANLTSPSFSGRVLRTAVFQLPWIGKAIATAVRRSLPLLERLGWRRLWERGSGAVRLFNYYAAAAEALETPAELQEISGLNTATWVEPDLLTVNLMDGVEAISALVAKRLPRDLSIMFGTWQIAYLWGAPGAEPLEPRHLMRALDENIFSWAKLATALESLPPLPGADPAGFVGLTPRGETGYSLGTLDLANWSLTARNETLNYPMRLLVRRGEIPIGWVRMIAAPQKGQFWETLRLKILYNRALVDRLVRCEMLPTLQQATPPISVVICTRDRPDSLRRCLAAVQSLDYPDFEVVVVDNASVSDTTKQLVQSLPGLRYVRENRPGLDWARNRGIAEARHDFIAYTDDDTQVDAHWLRGFAAAFAEPGVDAVTGLVVPMKLDTMAQVYFEDVYGGMGRGFSPWFRHGGTTSTRDILWSSGCGVGANMAFRRAVFDEVGRFDPALDVGTATRGGGDIEMFHRVMAKGCGLAYTPAAFVWHEHRTDFPALLRQLRDNGSGFAAYLQAAWRNRTVGRGAIAVFALKEWIWGWQIKRLIRPGRHRRETVLAELGGLMQGRRFYVKARVDAEVLAATAPPEPHQVNTE